MADRSMRPSQEAAEVLVDRCKGGDRAAFRDLVEAYRSYAYALAFRIVLEEDEALDVTQESFLRVWKHLGRYDARMKFTTWLYRIVVNLAYDSVRSRQRRWRFFRAVDEIEDHEGASQVDMETELTNKDLADRIRALAQELPERQRLVFVLRDLQDLSVRDVASVLGISENAVKANLCYARRTLREHMVRFTEGGKI